MANVTDLSSDEDIKTELLSNLVYKIINEWQNGEYRTEFITLPKQSTLFDGMQVTAEVDNPEKHVVLWKRLTEGNAVTLSAYKIDGSKIYLQLTLDTHAKRSFCRRMAAMFMFAMAFACTMAIMWGYWRCG